MTADLDDVAVSGLTLGRDRLLRFLRAGKRVQWVADISGWSRPLVIRAGIEDGLVYAPDSDVMRERPPVAPAPNNPQPAGVDPLAARAADADRTVASLRHRVEAIRREMDALNSSFDQLTRSLTTATRMLNHLHVPDAPKPARYVESPRGLGATGLDRSAAGRATNGAYAAAVAETGVSSAAIREWALGTRPDLRCPERGRIPLAVIDAYIAAHPRKEGP